MQNVNTGPASWFGEELRRLWGDEYSTHEGLFVDPHFEVNFMMPGSDDDQQIGWEKFKANEVVAALQRLAKKAAGLLEMPCVWNGVSATGP